MPHFGFDPYLLAGPSEQGRFPPTLNTATPATELRADETPDGYGFDLSVDGKIGKGTIPSGTARVERTVTLGTGTGESEDDVPYYWHYGRLWNITGRTASGTSNLLAVGARRYDSKFYYQGPDLAFNEDGNPILALVPFEPDGLAVIKSSGAYLLTNCSDTRGPIVFQRTDIIQELSAAGATHVAELNGAVIVSNASGLIAYAGGSTKELTRPVRNDLTGFTSVALTVDYAKQRIIGGTSFVYDFIEDRLYKFSGSSFRFTTRQFHMPDYAPFSPDRVVFIIEHGDSTSGFISYQVRFEDEAWGTTYKDTCNHRSDDENTVVCEPLPESFACRRFQVRLTDMPDNKYIRAIRLDSAAHNFDDYSV